MRIFFDDALPPKRFNTASGMDCMQYGQVVAAKGFAWFQYRKRYGLHAMKIYLTSTLVREVSIPQAVWIACNDRF